MQRASDDPAAKPEPQREGGPSGENVLVRYLATLDDAEHAVLQELAELDKVHGDKPTPPK